MRDWTSQSHVRWYCKYHVVFVPKYRRKALYGSLRREIGRGCSGSSVSGKEWSWLRVMRWWITSICA